MNKILSISPEQWAQIDRIKIDWLLNASRSIDRDDATKSVNELYQLAGIDSPLIILTDSPATALMADALLKKTNDRDIRDSLGDSLWDSLGDSLGDSLRDSLRDSLWDSLWDSLGASLGDSLQIYWHQSYCAFVEGGKIAGVKYDIDKYNKYLSICKNLSFIIPYKNICIVAANPIYIGWSDNGEIHAEDRAAVEYADGFKIWAIEGYRVPESLVMHPNLQTIEDINNEENEEIKRIRINRYGWDRYLTESNAIVLDFWTSPNGYLESLMQCGGYTILCTYDPSTGRPYSLEVDPSIDTCEGAQRYLLAPEIALNGLGIECKSNYPTIRT